MNLSDMTLAQVQEYIRTEHRKGRPMREVILEVVTLRDDVTLLTPDPQVSEQQMLEALGITR